MTSHVPLGKTLCIKKYIFWVSHDLHLTWAAQGSVEITCNIVCMTNKPHPIYKLGKMTLSIVERL